MNGEYIRVGYLDLLIAGILMVVSMVVSWKLHLGLQRDMLTGAIRSLIQLMLVGFVLAFIIREQTWYWTLLALTVMLGVAVQTAAGRVKDPLSGKLWVFSVAIVCGSLVVLLYVTAIVLRLHPWYDAQYLLPLAGMIIGNGMTAATLAMGRFVGDLRTRRQEVETALALGATAVQAVQPIRRDALRTAIIPSVNSLLVVGIVSLPGMMTGQIIAGQDPTQAVHYQIVVMYMITAATSLTSVIAISAAITRAFTSAMQLREG